MKKISILSLIFFSALLFFMVSCAGANDKESGKTNDSIKSISNNSTDLSKFAFTINDSLGTKYREEAVMRIRNLYYALPKQNLDKKEYIETVSEGNKKITYYFSPTAIKKITVETQIANETISKEFCYAQNQLYFIFQTKTSKGSETESQKSKLLQMRFYLENNLLLKSIITQSLLPKDAKSTEESLNPKEYYSELNKLISESNVLISNTRDIKLVNPEYEIGEFPSFSFINSGMIVVEQGVNYKLKGKPYAINGQMNGTAFCEVEVSSLPEKYVEMLGQTFDVYADNEKLGENKITRLLLMVKYSPHFGEIQRWEEDKISESAYAKSLFDENADIITLVAELEGNVSDNSIWARLGSLPKPSLFNPAATDAAFTSLSQSLFLKTEEVKKESKGYIDYCKENNFTDLASSWTEYATPINYSISTPKLNMSIFILSSGEPCGQESYQAVVSKLYINDNELHSNKNKPVEMPYTFDFTTDTPIAAIDLNNDGYPELIFKDDYGRSVMYIYLKGEFIPSNNFNIPFRDCPC